MVPTCAAFNSRNLIMVEAQIQPTHYLPDQACTMILVDQSFDVDSAQNKL